MTAPVGFAFDDGGRKAAGFRGDTGDCVVRAVAIATGQPYRLVYDALSEGSRAQRVTRRQRALSSARNGVSVRRKWFRDYMTALGWVFVPTMRIGSGCTVHLNAAELPAGRLVVSVSKHYTTMIDGVIRDTFDPRERAVTIYPADSSDVPKGAVQHENGSWIYAPERCVYGYWRAA